MDCSQECREKRERVKAERAVWEAAHPGHCKVCGGAGRSVSPGSSVPYGSTYVSLPDDVDPCPACVEQGRCPWCGDTNLDDGRGRCRNVACRWQWDLAPPPAEAECLCWCQEGPEEWWDADPFDESDAGATS